MNFVATSTIPPHTDPCLPAHDSFLMVLQKKWQNSFATVTFLHLFQSIIINQTTGHFNYIVFYIADRILLVIYFHLLFPIRCNKNSEIECYSQISGKRNSHGVCKEFLSYLSHEPFKGVRRKIRSWNNQNETNHYPPHPHT